MKTVLFAFMLLAFLQSNGQGVNTDMRSKNERDSANAKEWDKRLNSPWMKQIIGFYTPPPMIDTIPVVMLVSDTLAVVGSGNVFGYMIQRYGIAIEYLYDDKKTKLPPNLIVWMAIRRKMKS